MATPTMEDVAERAGVSRALVSLVMRSSPKVSAGRREAVLRAAEELGYSPHAAARSLASRNSRILGVLVSDLHNPFFAEIIDGIDVATHAEGFELVINTGGRSPSRERAAVTNLLSFRPAGILLLGPAVPASVIADAAAKLPVVLVARGSRLASVDTVQDHGKVGSALAVDRLVELGHSRIAHFDGGKAAQSAARRTGYRTAMRRHGLEPDVFPSEYTEVAGEKAAAELLARGDPLPTAVLAANDVNAIGAISTFGRAGLRVPEDISVVGYDNTSLAAFRHIGLTTVHQPRAEMGRLATEALLQRVRGERATPVRHLLRPALVERTTTGATS
ncbi:transcriptional regulator, LacI family [Haloechinothrix alba]|uniref:Transcriptional regulator, LacI family n=1 Tax=Haloechinothrix alba TaxID=664784 RepID=A0A238W3A4_9PSEU|nr:LacI family DNA-binding transcriptional regulator [Haloechinothrix alba]SNR40824.1 transcriptional regulator, LacI family [Haloechinothrix alba]